MTVSGTIFALCRSIFCLALFRPAWRMSFGISCGVGVLVMFFFQLSYVWKSLYFTFAFERYFLHVESSRPIIFSFGALKISFHCLFACIIFYEKLAIILIFVALNVTCLSSLDLLRFFSLLWVLNSLIMICLGVLFFIILVF